MGGSGSDWDRRLHLSKEDFSSKRSLKTRDVRKPNFGSVSVYKNPNRTEPKLKGQIRNFGFRGFSQNQICFIHIVNI